ncbi:MAG: hypothetical protein QF473_25650 [Planctomycetota bacterium]|nr:hypothetical protein [Planctomycetota bacterium]
MQKRDILVYSLVLLPIGLFILYKAARPIPNATPEPDTNQKSPFFERLEKALPEIQHHAVRNITKPGNPVSFEAIESLKPQTAVIKDSIRFIYTVEHQDDSYLHTVSSQLTSDKPQRFHVEGTLMVMLLLNRQLTAAGFDAEEIKLDLDKSDMGTHFIELLLTPQQQQNFVESLD